MKEPNQLVLFDNQNHDDLESNICFENKDNLEFQKNNFLFPLSGTGNAFLEKTNELEEFKKIMDNSKSENTNSDITDGSESSEPIYFIRHSKNESQSTFNTSKNILFTPILAKLFSTCSISLLE